MIHTHIIFIPKFANVRDYSQSNVKLEGVVSSVIMLLDGFGGEILSDVVVGFYHRLKIAEHQGPWKPSMCCIASIASSQTW